MPGWGALVVLCAGLLAYANSVSGPFILDDLISIVDNVSIRQWSRLGAMLFPERELPVAGRPLVNVSFALNYAVGGLNVVGYHLVNIAFHVASALLVFGLVRRTLLLSNEKVSRGSLSPTAFGMATALLWELHPLNTEAVDFLTQRTELMMGFFYVLTLYASVTAFRPGRPAPWQAVALLSCAAGMACKESMATAPVVVVLFDRAFLFRSFKEAVKVRWKLYTGLAASWLLLAALLSSGPRIHSAGFGAGVSPWTYLLNQAVMITRYLRLALWPRGLVVNYGPPLPFAVGDVWIYGLLILALVLLTAVVWVRAPKIGFLGMWFFVTLAPASSVIPIATEVGAERRMYLPLLALVILFVALVDVLTSRTPVVTRLRPLFLIVVAAALAAGTISRNQEYASAVRLAETVLQRYPTSVAHHALGDALIEAGRPGEAEGHLRQALPGDPRARYTLGLELFKQKRFDEAIAQLQGFVREEPLRFEAAAAREVLGRAFAQQQRWPEAVEQYRLAFAMDPSRLDAHVEIQGWFAEALYHQGALSEAVQRYREYLKARPDDVAALSRLGIALVGQNKQSEALVVFRHAVEVEPQSGETQRNLAMALLEQGYAAEAVDHARRAAALRPGDQEALNLLKLALAGIR